MTSTTPPLPVRLRPDPAADRAELIEAMIERRFLAQYDDPAAARAAATAWQGLVAGRVSCLRVLVDGVERGRVWTLTESDDLVVAAQFVEATAPGLSAGLRDSLERHARAVGLRRLAVEVRPGDVAAEALVARGGFQVVATRMLLDLVEAAPDPVTAGLDPERDLDPDLRLEPMDEAAFALRHDHAIASYAESQRRSGHTREAAMQISVAAHQRLLPDGLATPDQHFFVGRDASGASVAMVWIGAERPMHYVYQLEVDPDHRRRGHGSRLMRAAARWSREHGAIAVGLNVFGFNAGARALYDTLGYRVVETALARPVGEPDGSDSEAPSPAVGGRETRG